MAYIVLRMNIDTSYALYANDPNKREEIDLAYYVNTVLSRRVKASIAAARKEVKKIETEYF